MRPGFPLRPSRRGAWDLWTGRRTCGPSAAPLALRRIGVSRHYIKLNPRSPLRDCGMKQAHISRKELP